MTKKLITTTAMAALAFPGAALATDGDHGAHGKSKAKQAKQKKGKGFALAGSELTALPVTDGKLTGALTLDPTSANRHARRLLGLTKAEIRGEDTVSLGAADDAVLVRSVGLNPGDAIQPTDRVKIVGKVRNGTLDIRKITIIRGETTSTSTAAKKAKSEHARSGKARAGHDSDRDASSDKASDSTSDKS